MSRSRSTTGGSKGLFTIPDLPDGLGKASVVATMDVPVLEKYKHHHGRNQKQYNVNERKNPATAVIDEVTNI